MWRWSCWAGCSLGVWREVWLGTTTRRLSLGLNSDQTELAIRGFSAYEGQEELGKIHQRSEEKPPAWHYHCEVQDTAELQAHTLPPLSRGYVKQINTEISRVQLTVAQIIDTCRSTSFGEWHIFLVLQTLFVYIPLCIWWLDIIQLLLSSTVSLLSRLPPLTPNLLQQMTAVLQAWSHNRFLFVKREFFLPLLPTQIQGYKN